MRRDIDEAVPVKKDLTAASFAQFGGATRDGVEHRLQVGWRTADYAQDFGGGRLLLQRLLGLVEQPGVLDGYQRLPGEALRDGDLTVRERPYSLARSG